MLRPFPSPHRTTAAAATPSAAAADAAMAPSSSRSPAGGGAHHHGHHVSVSPSPSTCKHTPSSATLDLLILLLVLFSLAFLLASSLAHVSRSLSPLLASPPAAAALAFAAAALPYLAAAAVLAAAAFLSCRRLPRRRCRNPRCRGLRKALEFDVQLQTEEAVRAGAGSTVGGADAAMWREIEALPWKGGQGGNTTGLDPPASLLAWRSRLGADASSSSLPDLLFLARRRLVFIGESDYPRRPLLVTSRRSSLTRTDLDPRLSRRIWPRSRSSLASDCSC